MSDCELPTYHWRRTVPVRGLAFIGLLLVLTLSGCPVLAPKSSPTNIASKSRLYSSMIDRVAPMVQPDIETLHGPQQQRVLATHAIGRDVPAKYKRRIALQSLTDPWAGFSTLEHQGLLMSELASGGTDNLPALLDVMEAAVDRTSEYFKPIPFPATTAQKEVVTFLTDTLEDAAIQREKALANLSDDERRFLFKHARTLAELEKRFAYAFRPHKGGWFGRPVAVPIEVVAILGSQIASLDMPPKDYAAAPTWAAGKDMPIPDNETIRIALTRR